MGLLVYHAFQSVPATNSQWELPPEGGRLVGPSVWSVVTRPFLVVHARRPGRCACACNQASVSRGLKGQAPTQGCSGLGSGSGLWACGQQVAPETEGGGRGGDAGQLGASAGHASSPRHPGPLARLHVRPQHVPTLTCTLPLTCPRRCPLLTQVHVRTDRPALHKLTGFQSHPVLIFLTRKLQFRPRLGLSQTRPLPHVSFKAEIVFRTVCSLQNARPSPATLEPTPSFLL